MFPTFIDGATLRRPHARHLNLTNLLATKCPQNSRIVDNQTNGFDAFIPIHRQLPALASGSNLHADIRKLHKTTRFERSDRTNALPVSVRSYRHHTAHIH
jgi:hypothetical protein